MKKLPNSALASKTAQVTKMKEHYYITKGKMLFLFDSL